LPSDLNAAFLLAQLEKINLIQKKRKAIFTRYVKNLTPLSAIGIETPFIPDYANQNGHIFYIKCKNEQQRNSIINYLKSYNVNPASHYISLHQSSFYKKRNNQIKLINSDKFTKNLLRLPLYFDLSFNQVDFISTLIINFFKKNK
jgi:dTDP-4-amino-4,6-dideoxygalactose transaminase